MTWPEESTQMRDFLDSAYAKFKNVYYLYLKAVEENGVLKKEIEGMRKRLDENNNKK